MLRFLARFVAILCAVAFVFFTVPGVFFYAAGTRILQAQTYKDALIRERIYERYPELVADIARREAQGGRAQDAAAVALAQLTPADWRSLLGATVPATYLQQETEHGLDRIVEFLHSDASTPSVPISLAELKQHLVSPEAERAYTDMLQSKPLCTPQQLEDAGGLPVGCRPPPERMPQVLQAFRSAMHSVADTMPDTLDLFAPGFADPGARTRMATLVEARGTLRRIERWAQWSPAVPAALLLLIALFGVRSLRGWLLWWGIPCCLAGSVAAVLAFPVAPITRWVFSSFVVPAVPAEVPPLLAETMFGLVTAVVQEVMTAALTPACIMAAGGLLCMIAARFLKSRAVPVAAKHLAPPSA
jgi:hypothetical protein